MDLAQSKHIVLAKPPPAPQEVVNLAGAIYPLTVANDAASSPYSVLKAFLLFIHTYSQARVS